MAKEKAKLIKEKVAKKVEVAKNKVKAIKPATASADSGPESEDEDEKVVENLTKKSKKEPQDEPSPADDAEDIEL